MGISQTELRDIMAQHAAPMLLYARQLLDYHTAEEVVQDAFFRLSREETVIENVTAWLYRTVRNGAVSRKRGVQIAKTKTNACPGSSLTRPINWTLSRWPKHCGHCRRNCGKS